MVFNVRSSRHKILLRFGHAENMFPLGFTSFVYFFVLFYLFTVEKQSFYTFQFDLK